MARTERSGRRGPIFLLTLLLCGALSALHARTERAHGLDPVTGVVRDAALVPALGLTVKISRWWHDHIASAFLGPGLARQNAALQAEVTTLTLQNQRLVAAQVENVRLRQLLHFQQKSDHAPLAAEVVALKPSPLTDTLILARGLRDGVKPQTTVLGPSGALAGQVLDASFYSSSVLLLTDPGSSVGAQASRQGKPGPVGICVGDRTRRLVLTDLPRDADVRPGDSVTTSGLGGVFPKGIRIGIVLSVVLDRTRSLKAAQVRSAVDFDHLEDVFMLIPPPAPAANAIGTPDGLPVSGTASP